MNKLEWLLAGGLIVLGLSCLIISATFDPGQSFMISKPVLVPICVLIGLLFVVFSLKYFMSRWMKK